MDKSARINYLIRERMKITETIKNYMDTMEELNNERLKDHHRGIIINMEMPWLTGAERYRNFRLSGAHFMENVSQSIQLDIDDLLTSLRTIDTELIEILQGEVK